MKRGLLWLAAVGCLALALCGLWLWRPEAQQSDAAREGEVSVSSDRESESAPLDLAESHDVVAPIPERAKAAPSVATSPEPRLRSQRENAAIDVASSRASDALTILVRYSNGVPSSGSTVRIQGADLSGGAARTASWSLDRTTDGVGRVHVKRADLQASPCIVMHAIAEPGYRSREIVLTDRGAVPSEIELVLDATVELRIRALSTELVDVGSVEIVVATLDGHMPLVRERVIAELGGLVTLRVARGRYEVSARSASTSVRASQTIVVDGDQDVRLSLDAAPSEPRAIAVSGVVLDEGGRGLAGVTVFANRPPKRSVNKALVPYGRSVVTNERGEFELRGDACDELEVRASGEPLLATFEPGVARVACGSTGVVIRRVRTWQPNLVRIRALDAASGAPIESATLSMRLLPDGDGQRIYRGRNGSIDAAIPWRDDVGWKIEAFGYRAAEGRVPELEARVREGALEIALQRDPSVVELADQPTSSAGVRPVRRVR